MKAFKIRLEVGDFLCTALGFLSATDTTMHVPKAPEVIEVKKAGRAVNTAGNTRKTARTLKTAHANGEPFYEPGCSRYSTGEFEGKYRPYPTDERGEAVEECVVFLEECGVVFLPNAATSTNHDLQPPVIDCKQSLGSLRMPQEKDAVAHGDAALDLNDFLKDL